MVPVNFVVSHFWPLLLTSHLTESLSTVATQIEFAPDIGGVCSGSMIMDKSFTHDPNYLTKNAWLSYPLILLVIPFTLKLALLNEGVSQSE